jgi:hypothetical protein
LPGELCTYKIQYHKYVLRDADTTSTDRIQESAPSRCAYSSTPTTRLTDVLPSAAVQRWSRQDTCRSAGGSCQCVRKFVRTPLDANSHLRLAHANTASSVASHGAVASARSEKANKYAHAMSGVASHIAKSDAPGTAHMSTRTHPARAEPRHTHTRARSSQ